MRRSYIKKKTEERLAHLNSPLRESSSDNYYYSNEIDGQDETNMDMIEDEGSSYNYFDQRIYSSNENENENGNFHDATLNHQNEQIMLCDSKDIASEEISNVEEEKQTSLHEERSSLTKILGEKVIADNQDQGKQIDITLEEKMEANSLNIGSSTSIKSSYNKRNTSDTNLGKSLPNKPDSSESVSIGDLTFDGEEGDPDALQIPFQSVKRIMKINPEVNMIARESYLVTGKVTELFIDKLARKSYQIALHNKRKQIKYEDVADARVSDPNLQFLEGVLPAV